MTKSEKAAKGKEKKAKNKFKEDDKVFAMDGGDLYEAKVRVTSGLVYCSCNTSFLT